MPVAAIIPIRSFTDGKGRLASALDAQTRSLVATSMAERTLTATESALMIPAIVTADTGVASWAASLGIPVIEESGRGLNGAATDGMRWATDNNLQWLILHSDLPLITGPELGDVALAVGSGSAVLAPSADGGTSGLSSPTPIEFRYGSLSAHRHLAQMADVEVIARTGLLHDLDSPNDLQTAMSHREGKWLRAVVGWPDPR
ncbi:MAG: 2-phospho-L-lactate guanylyltransferase [Acidimicrobiia bacterium]